MKTLSRSGFGLLEIIIATLIVGAVSVLLGKFLISNLKMAKHTEIKGEIEQMRQYIRSNISCYKSLTPMPAACSSGQGYIPLVKSDSQSSTLIEQYSPPAVQMWGNNYELRASCPNGNHLLIEYSRVYSANSLATTDPLTQQQYKWQDLFGGDPAPCGQMFGTMPPTCPPPGKPSATMAIGFDLTTMTPVCGAPPAPQFAQGTFANPTPTSWAQAGGWETIDTETVTVPFTPAAAICATNQLGRSGQWGQVYCNASVQGNAVVFTLTCIPSDFAGQCSTAGCCSGYSFSYLIGGS